jgi:hypothetical protein
MCAPCSGYITADTPQLIKAYLLNQVERVRIRATSHYMPAQGHRLLVLYFAWRVCFL